MNKEDKENIEISWKSWVCDNTFVKSDVKVGDHCYVTWKYRGAARRDYDINVSVNCKIPIVFTI